MTRRVGLLHASVLLLAGAVWGQDPRQQPRGQGFVLEQAGVSNGAATLSGGEFQVVASVGQPGGGGSRLAGGPFDVTTGVVAPFSAGDCDGDDGVSLLDHAGFVECATGPVPESLTSSCRCFDANNDGTADLRDFGLFQRTFTGS